MSEKQTRIRLKWRTTEDRPEVLPAERLMRASRKIRNVGGPVALGSLTIMFPGQAECEEFLEALIAFRRGRKVQTTYFDGGKTERDVTDE